MPLRGEIRDCHFVNNKNHVAHSMNDGIVRGCVFQEQGNSITTTEKLNLGFNSGQGDRNQVVGNYFAGTYSDAGGYQAGTNDTWAGNFTEAGITTAQPV